MRRLTRFSIRTLLVLALLLAGYLACGPVTKSRGVEDVSAFLDKEGDYDFVIEYQAPLLLSGSVQKVEFAPDALPRRRTRREYYVWCFGFVAKVYGNEQTEDAAVLYERGIPLPGIEIIRPLPKE